jgi:hypothetical protein
MCTDNLKIFHAPAIFSFLHNLLLGFLFSFLSLFRLVWHMFSEFYRVRFGQPETNHWLFCMSSKFDAFSSSFFNFKMNTLWCLIGSKFINSNRKHVYFFRNVNASRKPLMVYSCATSPQPLGRCGRCTQSSRPPNNLKSQPLARLSLDCWVSSTDYYKRKSTFDLGWICYWHKNIKH